MNIFARILLEHKLNRFVNSAVKRAKKFTPIDDPFTYLIEGSGEKGKQLKASVLARYQKAAAEIAEHNAKIQKILEAEARYRDLDILKDPQRYSSEIFDPIIADLGLLSLLDRRSIPKKLSCVQEDANFIKNNIEAIKKQFSLHETLFESTQYYSSSDQTSIAARIAAIRARLKETGIRPMYDFSILDSEDEYRNRLNEAYLNQNIKSKIFDDINGCRLDDSQRRAILTDDDRVLLLAGAGCGKTTTISGKIRWLIEHERVDPATILVLSYSRNSCRDLKDKIGEKIAGIKIDTFHALAYEIIKDHEERKPLVDDQFEAIFESYFDSERMSDDQVISNIIQYYSLYLFSSMSTDDQIEEEKFINYNNLQSLKNLYFRKMTFKKEKVKSLQELSIANFYFLHGIDYEYEKPYKIDTATIERRQYLPDFYLTKYDIYHEHFGIDKNGRAPQFGMGEKEYLNSMAWKEKIHQENGTVCLKTYSYNFTEGDWVDVLSKQLTAHRVEIQETPTEVKNRLLSKLSNSKSFRYLKNLLRSVLILLIDMSIPVDQIDALAAQMSHDRGEIHKYTLLFKICKDIYAFYRNQIDSRGKIDFSEMINLASNYLQQTSLFKYRYVIVDEFQDISNSRLNFLRRILDHGRAKLLAVGDDWQSIYGFNGSNVSSTSEFSKLFPTAKILTIPRSHRLSLKSADISSSFIMKNPHQIKKSIVGSSQVDAPLKFVYYTQNKPEALATALDFIGRTAPAGKILILARNNFDIEEYLNKEFLTMDKNRGIHYSRYPDLDIGFMTIHASKGLEADHVIVLNLEIGKYGLPNLYEPDPIISRLSGCQDSFPHAEERRLFYVAMTRAKRYTILLVNPNQPSIFASEIESKAQILNPEIAPLAQSRRIHCPRCRSGYLVRRDSGKGAYVCSNYPYCKYHILDAYAVKRNLHCPRCNDFLVTRQKDRHFFLGCHSYPECRFTTHYVTSASRKTIPPRNETSWAVSKSKWKIWKIIKRIAK